MNTKTRVSTLALALATCLPLGVASPSWAQSRATASATASATSIFSFDVEPLQNLRPGEVLTFGLRATPGASAAVTIEGAAQQVVMVETRPGVYEGSYTIRTDDRLNADSRVNARVLHEGRAATASLARSLVVGSPGLAPMAGNSISDFRVTAPERVRPGEELNFSLTGEAGGRARVALDGVGAAVPLREVRRGVYEGSYVVRRQDRLRGGLTAKAYLVNGGRESSQGYERVLVADDNRRPQPACASCGTVETVRRVEKKGGGSNVLGTIAGGILGGVVGNQVGGGSGKDIARVIGAVGGAYAGNRVQNNRNKDEVWRVTVRLQGGTTQDFDYADDPAVAVGTRVKVDGEVLVRM